MCDAVYHTISKIEEVEIDVEEELPNEPILLYYKNYDAMIEATEYFQFLHISKLAKFRMKQSGRLPDIIKVMYLKHLEPI